MQRFALLLVLLLAACATLPRPLPRGIRPVVTAETNPLEGVWRIDGDDGFGTGFPVACEELTPGVWRVTFITAAHIPGEDWALTHHTGGMVGLAYDIQRHKKADVAKFYVDTPFQIVPRRLSSEPVLFGELLVAAGYHFGFDLWLQSGPATPPNKVGAFVLPGCSGGPLSRPSGEIVGVVVAILQHNGRLVPGCAYFVPTAGLIEWMLDAETD